MVTAKDRKIGGDPLQAVFFIDCGLEELLKNTSLRRVSVGLGLLKTSISFCVRMDRRSAWYGGFK